MHVSFTGAKCDALDAVIMRAPAQLRPAFLEMRNQGCGFVLASQRRGRFVVQGSKALVEAVSLIQGVSLLKQRHGRSP